MIDFILDFLLVVLWYIVLFVFVVKVVEVIFLIVRIIIVNCGFKF